MTGMTLDEAVQHVIDTIPTFALTTTQIRGVTQTVFANTPAHLRDLLLASRAAQGDGTADYLVFGDQRWSYDEFCEDVRRMADVLTTQYGVTNGTRVGIAMRNCPELLVVMMAVVSAGGVAVMLNAWWTTEELDYAIDIADLQVIFADGDRLNRLNPLTQTRSLTLIGVQDGEALAHANYSHLLAQSTSSGWPDVKIENDDDFAIMFSSGTTSHPKGVVLTHRGAINAVFSWLMQFHMGPMVNPPAPDTPAAPRPCALVVTPLFHVTASHPLFLLSLPAGAKIVVMGKWDAEEAVRLIRDENVTRFLGVPTQCADLLSAAQRMGESLSTLDYIGSGGAKRPAAQVQELTDGFPNADIATGWGMTETNALGIGLTGDDYVDHPGAAGRLHAPVQSLRFLDDDGDDVPTGEVGEITVKSPATMRCYLNNPDATNEVLQDGWLRTGDLGRIDAHGLVTIVDRKKNIVIRGGENIACLDVEGALHRHPAVAEACAFAVPHERLGEVVGAGVQTRTGMSVSMDELKTFLREHIAHFKVPDHIWIQSEPLPRGATDKLDRRMLRARCLQTLAVSDP